MKKRRLKKEKKARISSHIHGEKREIAQKLERQNREKKKKFCTEKREVVRGFSQKFHSFINHPNPDSTRFFIR